MRQDISPYEEKPLRTVGLLQAAHQYSLQDMSGSASIPTTLYSLHRSGSSENLTLRGSKANASSSLHVHPSSKILFGDLLQLTSEIFLCTDRLLLEPRLHVFVFTLDCNKRAYCYDAEDACEKQSSG